MPTIRDVLIALEQIAPKRFALGFDKVGLQVGSPEQVVTKAVVSLDRSIGAVKFASELGAELLLAHHPLIFNPMDSVDTRSHQGRTVVKLIQNGTSFIAAHTNWDAAKGGINDTLAQLFELKDVIPFGMAAEVRQFKLIVTCPDSDVERLIDAASDAGAGVIGAYRRCAFVGTGIGTYIGDESSNPTVGTAGEREQVNESRIEMIVPEERANIVERAIRKAHSYEEPAYEFFALRGKREQPASRLGTLPRPMKLSEFAALADQLLEVRSWTWGDPNRTIKKVGFTGGAADTDWMDAQRAGADLFMTGEIKQHIAVEATESGMTLVAAGHYQTEQPGTAELCNRMKSALPDVEWHLFTPPIGLHGRPF